MKTLLLSRLEVLDNGSSLPSGLVVTNLQGDDTSSYIRFANEFYRASVSEAPAFQMSPMLMPLVVQETSSISGMKYWLDSSSSNVASTIFRYPSMIYVQSNDLPHPIVSPGLINLWMKIPSLLRYSVNSGPPKRGSAVFYESKPFLFSRATIKLMGDGLLSLVRPIDTKRSPSANPSEKGASYGSRDLRPSTTIGSPISRWALPAEYSVPSILYPGAQAIAEILANRLSLLFAVLADSEALEGRAELPLDDGAAFNPMFEAALKDRISIGPPAGREFLASLHSDLGYNLALQDRMSFKWGHVERSGGRIVLKIHPRPAVRAPHARRFEVLE